MNLTNTETINFGSESKIIHVFDESTSYGHIRELQLATVSDDDLLGSFTAV